MNYDAFVGALRGIAETEGTMIIAFHIMVMVGQLDCFVREAL